MTTAIGMGMAAEAEWLNEDDFPINKKGDKTKLIVLIVVSIMMCNVCCLYFHRRSKRIFFISKSQIDRIRESIDYGDDYDSEHFEYLNEPNRISFVMNARDRWSFNVRNRNYHRLWNRVNLRNFDFFLLCPH